MSHIPEGGELREATVLFCDLGGYTAWNEEEEPEAVVAVMDRIKLQAIRVFEEHGGIANQFVGDEILGLFGVTSSHEDDPCRAVSAALELHEFVRMQQVKRADGSRRLLELHTGIETGSVYVRVTDTRAGLYDVTGDTVNTAARFRSLAEAGQILIGPTTNDWASMVFETAPLPAVHVRGKAQPVTPYRVLSRARTSNSWTSSFSRKTVSAYVGRDHQLAALAQWWQRACTGRACLVSVEGAAGIGKSRLFYELRRLVDSDGATPLVLHGRCSAYRAAPYDAFIGALSTAAALHEGESLAEQLSALAPISEASLRTLGALLAPTSADGAPDGERMRQAIVDALIELVVSAAKRRPVLLALEDFHDADEPTRAAVEALQQAAAGERLLIAINRRPSERATLPSIVDEHIRLEPFDGQTTQALACNVLSASAMEPELAAYIHERTLGNPFFVEEICRALADGNAISRRFGFVVATRMLETSRSPRSVRSIVRARIESLPALHKKLLRLASVLGIEFATDALEMLWVTPRPAQSALISESAWRLVNQPEDVARVRDLLADLELQGLVQSNHIGGYRFKHAITQELVYESLPRHERRWYHGRVAEWTEQQLAAEDVKAHYETLAHHYDASVNVAKAIDYAILSGEKAWRAFSLEQAMAQYGRAIALLDAQDSLSVEAKQRYIEVSVCWARVGLYNPQAAQLTALANSLRHARELQDERRACVCLNWTSWIEYALGNYAGAVESSAAFAAAAEALQDDGFAAQALTNSGLARVLSGEYADAERAIRAGIARRGRSTGTAYAYSLGYLAMIYGDRGLRARAEACLDEAWQIVSASGRDTLQGPALIQRGMVQSWSADWAGCIESANLAHAAANRIGGPYIRAMSLVLRGYAVGMQSDDQLFQGIRLLQHGITALEGLGVRLHLSWCLANLGELLVRTSDCERAREVATLALARVAENDRMGESAAHRILASVARLRERNSPRVAEHLTRAMNAAHAKSAPREEALTLLAFAEHYRHIDELSRARECSASARRLFEELGIHGSPRAALSDVG